MTISDAELLAELGSDSLRNRVRRLLSSEIGRAEQQSVQRTRRSPIQMRREEFAAADRLIAMVTAEQKRPEPAEVAAGVEVGDG